MQGAGAGLTAPSVLCKQLAKLSDGHNGTHAGSACQLELGGAGHHPTNNISLCTPPSCDIWDLVPMSASTWHPIPGMLYPQDKPREAALLYFRGDPTCNVKFVQPNITRVDAFWKSPQPRDRSFCYLVDIPQVRARVIGCICCLHPRTPHPCPSLKQI